MAKSEYQEIKYMWIYETLRLESDETHKLGTNDIIRLIDKKYGVKLDRRAIYGCIDTINKYYRERSEEKDDYIAVEKSNPNRYYVKQRELNAHEIKFLLDAVQSAAFLPAGETAELSEKVAALAGLRRAEVLMRNTVSLDKAKHSNFEVYDTLDKINYALETKKKFLFKYFYLGLRLEREYRNDGKRYDVNPLGTVFVNGYYYLVCYNDEKKELRSYRVDRMSDCEVSTKNIAPAPCAEDFASNTVVTALTAFGMWGGDIRQVTIDTLKDHLGDIYDKFGEDIHVADWHDGRVRVTAPVILSPVFFGWLASYGDEMQIVYPQEAKNEFIGVMEKVIGQYKNQSD